MMMLTMSWSQMSIVTKLRPTSQRDVFNLIRIYSDNVDILTFFLVISITLYHLNINYIMQININFIFNYNDIFFFKNLEFYHTCAYQHEIQKFYTMELQGKSFAQNCMHNK